MGGWGGVGPGFGGSLGGGAGFGEELPVAFGLVGVVGGEARDGVVEAGGSADVAGEDGGVSGAGVAAGEDFAAEGGVFEQAGGFEVREIDGGFVIVELADEVVAAFDGGVAEEGVGLELHGALAVHDAVALVTGFELLAEIGSVGGGGLFLDLEEEGVGGAVALEVDAVIAQADGAGADDLEGDVERRVLAEEVAALGLEALGVGAEGVEDFACTSGATRVRTGGMVLKMRVMPAAGGSSELAEVLVRGAWVVRESRLCSGVARSARRRTCEMGCRVCRRWTW